MSAAAELDMEIFTMDEVHCHYTCRCQNVNPDIRMDNKIPQVKIEINRKCSKCNHGRILELVMGEVSMKVPRCKKCNCDTTSITIPMGQFLSFLPCKTRIDI